jgi:hypothetical protein
MGWIEFLLCIISQDLYIYMFIIVARLVGGEAKPRQ